MSVLSKAEAVQRSIVTKVDIQNTIFRWDVYLLSFLYV